MAEPESTVTLTEPYSSALKANDSTDLKIGKTRVDTGLERTLSPIRKEHSSPPEEKPKTAGIGLITAEITTAECRHNVDGREFQPTASTLGCAL